MGKNQGDPGSTPRDQIPKGWRWVQRRDSAARLSRAKVTSGRRLKVTCLCLGLV